jgi:hypothetical protein
MSNRNARPSLIEITAVLERRPTFSSFDPERLMQFENVRGIGSRYVVSSNYGAASIGRVLEVWRSWRAVVYSWFMS